MPYAIVINVPEAKDVCFVAMPFADPFHGVYNHLAIAASTLALRPVRIRTGEMQPGVNFTTDIVDAARSARLVAAVCSPEEGTGKANPNVMYELGWAHAMGKPTLILTSDRGTLPANLAGRHVLLYTQAEVGSDELTRRIKEGMRDILDRMDRDNPLTDPAYPDIHVAHERHLMFNNPVFWDHFRTILSFAKLTHDEHQQIDTAATDPLLSEVTLLFKNPGKSQRVADFLRSWRYYEQYYHNLTHPKVYVHLEDRVAEVDTAFDYIRTNAGPAFRRSVNDCYGFYKEIRDLLRGYPHLFETAANSAEDDAIPRQRDRQLDPRDLELVNRVFLAVSRVSKDTKSIVMYSDRLIVNLIEMIRRTGGDDSRDGRTR